MSQNRSNCGCKKGICRDCNGCTRAACKNACKCNSTTEAADAIIIDAVRQTRGNVRIRSGVVVVKDRVGKKQAESLF